MHAQRNAAQSVTEEHFSVEPRTKIEEFIADGNENRFVRLETGRNSRQFRRQALRQSDQREFAGTTAQGASSSTPFDVGCAAVTLQFS